MLILEIFTMLTGKTSVWIFNVSLVYISWNAREGWMSGGNMGEERTEQMATAFRTWFQSSLFWHLNAIKISSLLPPFPQLDNFASIVFVPTAVFACLCVKPTNKLTKKKKELVFWWFSWNGLLCRGMPEQAVHEWQDLAVLFERGSGEHIFPFTTGELLTGSSLLMKPYLLV